MSKEDVLVSERISDFCNFCTDVLQTYLCCYDDVNRYDQLTQDYLHILELDEQNYKGRAKTATRLAVCRRGRREAKDMVDDLSYLFDYLSSDEGAEMLKRLKHILGKTRDSENYHATRTYKFRMLQNEV